MIHVTIYNLSVAIQTNEQKFVDILNGFISTFYTLRGQVFNGGPSAQDKKFASVLSKLNVYYLHVNQFRHLLHYLKQVNFDIKDAVREDKREYSVEMEDYSVRDGWELRADQLPVVNFVTDSPVGSKMISLQTGKGKTFVALYSLAKVGMRMGVVILPSYIDKWVMDIAKIHKSTSLDVMVIQGGKSLKAAIHMAKEGTLTGKYFILSSRTLQDFITSYEEDMELCIETYGIHPIELFPLLKIGTLLIDETHQHFHAIFKIILHANVKLQVGLSATLISDDSVVTNAHGVVYPPRTIYDGGGLDKYTDVYALAYSMPHDLTRKVKVSNFGSNSYSHTAFEQSVSRFPPLLKFYTSVIDNILNDFYIDKYQPKDRVLIFVATVKMATYLTDRYTEKYPDRVVRRYCEDDSFDNIQEGEIVVTTVISAGTAIDVPDLRVVVQTVSISSSVSNIQTLGRLRKLKDNKDTRFCYLYAENLPKQRLYHHKRLELFRDRALTHYCFRARTSSQ